MCILVCIYMMSLSTKQQWRRNREASEAKIKSARSEQISSQMVMWRFFTLINVYWKWTFIFNFVFYFNLDKWWLFQENLWTENEFIPRSVLRLNYKHGYMLWATLEKGKKLNRHFIPTLQWKEWKIKSNRNEGNLLCI